MSSRTSWLRYLAVAAVGGVAIFLAARIIDVDRSPESDIVSLAVLPFEVLSADASKEYFADGMHEELISALSKSRALDVRSRTSTLLYRDTQLALPAIGEALNVNMLVEGTVRQAEDTVRVSVQLVDVERDSQLWSGNYEQTLSVAEIFSIQNEIAREISTALQVTLAAPALAVEQSLPTNNLQAYDFFMLGKYHYRRQLPGDIKQSVDNFEAAVALDPDFADAWDWLAYAYNHAATAVGYLSPHVAYPKARVAALRALEIDPQLATAISILGYIRAVYDWDWAGAVADMRMAISLDPDDSGTVWSLAHVLALLGRHDEAISLTTEFANRGADIGRRHQEVANRLYDAGRYDEALEWLAKASERGAEQAQIEDTIGIVLVGKGELDAALERFEAAIDAGQRQTNTLARLLYTYAATGQDEIAESLFQELLDRAATEAVSPITLATAFMGRGDRDLAMDYLENAAAARDRGILALPTDPFFSALHAEPRYQALIQQFGIPASLDAE